MGRERQKGRRRKEKEGRPINHRPSSWVERRVRKDMRTDGETDEQAQPASVKVPKASSVDRRDGENDDNGSYGANDPETEVRCL
jgi:hypothetical protein